MSSISDLYEPIISRDLENVPRAIDLFRREHSAIELLDAISRFALLAYNPAQHGKHAFIACVEAAEMTDLDGSELDRLLTECACYVASSRLPWSEPPVSEPPPVGDGPASMEMIQLAVLERDRLAGEKWLALMLQEAGFARAFFDVASRDLSDFGHKLIVASAAWRLWRRTDWDGFVTLRVAIDEWCAYGDASAVTNEEPAEDVALVAAIVDRIDSEDGSLESLHRLALFDAGIIAREMASDPTPFDRVCASIARDLEVAEPMTSRRTPVEPSGVVYMLARDYAQSLKARAIVKRLQPRYPSIEFDGVIEASDFNLRQSRYDEWSFA